ncbi:MAG: ABC transporter ATP-binding protein C-terminal domain-containing protein, partial [Thermoanaerobaculia bacterium]
EIVANPHVIEAYLGAEQ